MKFKNPFKKIKRSDPRNTSDVNTSNVFNMPSWFTSGGVSKTTALNIHSGVYGIVNIKANSIGQLPLKLMKKSSNGREVVSNSLSDLIINRPHKNRTPFTFWRTITAHKEIYGNAYVFVSRDVDGLVDDLVILHPHQVTPFENEEDNNELYYKVNCKKGMVLIHNMDILHFSSVYSEGYTGISFIDAVSNMLSLTKVTSDTAKEQALNSLKVSGVIKLASNLNADKIKEYQERFANMYANGWNSILVLDLGAEYQPIKFDVQDLKLLENNKISLQQLSLVSGVPMHMLGIMDGAKFNNIEHQNISFIQSCIQPDVIQIEQELNYKLLTDIQRKSGMYFKFNINALIRADMKTRAEYYNLMLPLTGITPNEVRELEERPTLGAIGDRPLVTLNYTFLDTLENHERIIKDATKGGEKNEDE